MNLDLEAYYMEILSYFQTNTHIGIALGFVLFLLLLRKPKLFFTIALIVVVNVSILYVISYTASISEAQKTHLISKTSAQVSAY